MFTCTGEYQSGNTMEYPCNKELTSVAIEEL
jgi:hypothetical protein